MAYLSAEPGEISLEALLVANGPCPAYISVERFTANQEALKVSRAAAPGLGAPRKGPALMGGLPVCGRCGCRMSVNYTYSWRDLRYCSARPHLLWEPGVSEFLGRCLDELLVALEVLAALRPAELELHLRAVEDVERQRQALHENWRLELERARHRADWAARQYHAGEPSNRLVARTLEAAW